MTQQLLDERYGRVRRPGRSRMLWIATAVVAVIAVVALAWTTVSNTASSVSADDTGFTLHDEHSVGVSFQVTAPSGRAVACALEALDEEFGVVGWRIVEYPPSESHARAFTERIPTVAQATTGLVNSCWVL